MSEHHAEGLSFLLPVYNQAGNIERIVAAWSVLLEKLNRPYELLLIDDGSIDATRQLIDGEDDKLGLLARIPHLKTITHLQRGGFGACIRDGLAASQYPLIFYTGCDHAYNPADLKTLLHRIAESDSELGRKIDVVNGYRSGTPVTGWRKWWGKAWRFFLRIALGVPVPPLPSWLGTKAHRYRLLIRALFGVRVGDIDSKFKLIRRRLFDRIPIQSDGDFVHAEILAKANFLGCLMDELPIAQRPGPFQAHAEQPAPVPLGKELRRVFFHPNFGSTTLVPISTPAPST